MARKKAQPEQATATATATAIATTAAAAPAASRELVGTQAVTDWSAVVTDKRFDGKGRALFAITFSNGAVTVQDVLEAASVEQLKQQAAAKIAALDARVAAIGAVAPGPVAAPVVTPPTQAEQDRQEFRRLWGRLQQVQKAVDAGLVPAADARVTSYRSTVQAAFNKVVANDGAVAALELL